MNKIIIITCVLLLVAIVLGVMLVDSVSYSVSFANSFGDNVPCSIRSHVIDLTVTVQGTVYHWASINPAC